MASIPEKQIKRLTTLIREAETAISAANELLRSYIGDGDDIVVPSSSDDQGGKVVEGVFDGERMIGPDGRPYPVPANYASKSNLVQGDILKLTVTDDGSLIYKQIGPVERKQLMGRLGHDVNGYFVETDTGKSYKVLLASVTYFKCRPGDTISIVIPADDEDAEWAAIETPL